MELTTEQRLTQEKPTEPPVLYTATGWVAGTNPTQSRQVKSWRVSHTRWSRIRCRTVLALTKST